MTPALIYDLKCFLSGEGGINLSLTLDQKMVTTMTKWDMMVRNRAGTRLSTADIIYLPTVYTTLNAGQKARLFRLADLAASG